MMKIKFKHLLIICLLFIVILPGQAYMRNENKTTFKGHYYEKTEKIHLHLNLENATLTAPGMEFLGKINGYINGNVYGIWLLTKFKIDKNVAYLRFSNDLGSDSQQIRLTQINDTTLIFEAIEGNYIKKIHKRKLVKIPNKLTFLKL